MPQVVKTEMTYARVLDDPHPRSFEAASVHWSAQEVGEYRCVGVATGDSWSKLQSLFKLARVVLFQKRDPEIAKVDPSEASFCLCPSNAQCRGLPVDVSPPCAQEFALPGASDRCQSY